MFRTPAKKKTAGAAHSNLTAVNSAQQQSSNFVLQPSQAKSTTLNVQRADENQVCEILNKLDQRKLAFLLLPSLRRIHFSAAEVLFPEHQSQNRLDHHPRHRRATIASVLSTRSSCSCTNHQRSRRGPKRLAPRQDSNRQHLVHSSDRQMLPAHRFNATNRDHVQRTFLSKTDLRVRSLTLLISKVLS